MKAWLKKVNWANSALVGLGILMGFFAGILTAKAPIKIDPEIDVSSLVSLLALFTATIVVPFKINSHISNRRNQKSILTNDIDEILHLIGQMRDLYEGIYNTESEIQVKDQRILLSLIRKINNRIDSLCGQVESSDKLGDLKVEVSLFFNKNIAPTYSEKFLPGNVIEESDCIRAINEAEALISVLKAKRYNIYD